MRNILLVAVLVVATAVPLKAQTQSDDSSRDAGQPYNTPVEHHNYGWIGLAGLLGLLGLRPQKSEAIRQLEATGANVKTVRT